VRYGLICLASFFSLLAQGKSSICQYIQVAEFGNATGPAAMQACLRQLNLINGTV
jgi:hypothetical protein